jgi:hypothetical protein
MNVAVPNEFRKACRNLVQASEVETAEDLLQFALIGIDQRDAGVIRAFLDDLASAQPSAEQLKELWSSVPSDIVLGDGEGIRTFLQLMRERLANPPYVNAVSR